MLQINLEHSIKVSKGAKIRIRYNQVPHLTLCLQKRYTYSELQVLSLNVQETNILDILCPSSARTLLKIYVNVIFTAKPFLSSNSKIDKTKDLKTNGSLMKVESIAESLLGHSAILLTSIKR